MADDEAIMTGISAVVGLWVLVSAFVFGRMGAVYWNDIVVGAAIVLLAGYGAFVADKPTSTFTWTAGLAAILGAWLIVAPFAFGVAMSTAMWSDVASGVIVLAFAGYATYQARGGTVGAAPPKQAAQ